MNFALGSARTKVLMSAPRSSEPNITTRPSSCVRRSRRLRRKSRLPGVAAIAFPEALSPARKRTNRASPPSAGTCWKAVAWRRSLMGQEFTKYSRALCRRTLLRICQASRGCWSVGLLPISSMAGALKTSRMLAVASVLPASAPTKAGKSAVRWWSMLLVPRTTRANFCSRYASSVVVRVVGEIKGVAALDAKEVAIDAALVAIVAAYDLRAGFGAAHAQRRLAAITAMGADGADVVHLPGTRLVAVRTGSERAHRADIDAHSAFFAFQVVFAIGGDGGIHPAVLDAQRPDVHGFAANAHAAVAQDAARPVEVHHRRPLLLVAVVLDVNEFRFVGAVGEGHVLQFAFAAGVAYRAVEGMIAEQQLDDGLARLAHFVGFGGDGHALGHDGGAGGLQLGHFLDAHQAHAARALQ